MKQIVLVLAVLAVPVVISQDYTSCQNQSGVSKDDVYKLKQGESVDSPELRAFTLCLLKQMSFISDNGTLQIDDLRKGLKRDYSDENVEKLIKLCAKQRNTPELTAYETALCLYQRAKEFDLLDCQSQSGVSKGDEDKLKQGERVDSPELRAFTLCLFKQMSFISDNGTLQIDDLRKGLKTDYSDENVERLIQFCAKQRDTPELTAYETALCVYEKAKLIRISNCQSGLSKNDADKLKQGERVDSPVLRAFTLCFFKEMSIISDNGILQIDNLRKSLKKEYSDENVEKLIKSCAKQRDTPELTAYETVLCIYQKEKEFKL